MEEKETNKMSSQPVCGLIWKMGLPMIISMVLQAVYNIVDTAFVINMGENGVEGNLALTFAFPVQLLIIAVGVGTGVGVNALLSKSLGEGNAEKSERAVGNGIFLGIIIYIAFLLFGLFGARPFIAMQAQGNELVTDMGGEYLSVCCCFSFGAVGFAVYERFLQSTGKTMCSTIAQIAGAATNIVLDYVFIYPLKMGIAGAALATVAGQILSLVTAMLFHYLSNKELHNSLKAILPSASVIREIYHIGFSAALMQGLLSVMMLGVNLILGTASNPSVIQGGFGIYYKVMQFALFACFGLSNTVISLLSYNYGRGDASRSRECVKWGIISSAAVAAVIAVLFEILARPLAELFGAASGNAGAEITKVVTLAIRIASAGYVFMAFSVAVQGVLQALGYAFYPLIISCLRLAVFVFPAVWIFTLSDNAASIVWWAFPLSELFTAAISLVFVLSAMRKRRLTAVGV